MMKRLALLFAISGMLLTAKGDTVTPILSSASTTSNDSVSEGVTNAGATQNIVGNAAWAAPLTGSSWVSFADTGSTSDPGFYTVPNGVSVDFQDTFSLSGAISSAYLDVLADDTVSVIVNGTTIYGANLGGSYPTCSSIAIGCLSSTEGMFNTGQLMPYLNANGMNTIDFVVYQEAGSSYGLDYAGAITTATPEPGTLLLLAAGFVGLLALKLRS